jgi:hypothetical protein
MRDEPGAVANGKRLDKTCKSERDRHSLSSVPTFNPANQGVSQMTVEQLKALKQIADAIIESVKAAGPLGAPGGTIYAALMAHGCTLNQYEQIMAGLVRAGKLRKSGECYHVA